MVPGLPSESGHRLGLHCAFPVSRPSPPPPAGIGLLSIGGFLLRQHPEEPLCAFNSRFPSACSSACFFSPRYISILPVIPVTLYLNPQEAIEARHPQEANRYFPSSLSTGKWEQADQMVEGTAKGHGHQDITLYK